MNAATTTARLVTAPARGGIAVILLTGPGAREVVGRVFRPRKAWPGEGKLALGWVVHGEELLDEAVVCLGDDWSEINIHGGPQVARKVLAALNECGVEIASGEGADPALLAEAAGGGNPAIAAEMLAALRSAATPLAAGAVTAQWSGGLTALAGQTEPAAGQLRRAADSLAVMSRLLCPAEVVIAGPPNAGKSALTNALVGREVSIVSDTPGTTRDWVRALADFGGVPAWLTDTAGLWARSNGVAAEAMRRAWERIESADVIVCVIGPPAVGSDDHEELLCRLRGLANVLEVAGKCDLAGPLERGMLAVSARSFAGVPELRRAVRTRLGFERFDPTAAMAFTARQAALLTAAADALDRGQVRPARSALDELLLGRPG